MADHGSGPRAFADPVIDIADMYVFPSPERPDQLVLVMDVFPFAGPGAFFSDAVDYRFRLRPVEIAATGLRAAFTVGGEEYVVTFRFGVPVESQPGLLAQDCTCITSMGHSAACRVNDEAGGQCPGLRIFAGRRMDPFFFDGVRTVQTVMSGKLSYEAVGTATTAHQNILSVIAEINIAAFTKTGHGPLFGVVSETLTHGSLSVRLERFGRPEIKNMLLLPRQYDQVNRDLEVRDLFNQEDAFQLGKAYAGAYRARLNANLAFWDGLDGKVDWPLGEHGAHPLTEFLLADFMVIDVSKPYAEDSAFEIKVAMLKGAEHKSCGGRSPNDDSIDTYLTLLVNAGNGPRISDGVDAPAVPSSRSFPYLVPPEPNPPPVRPPALNPAH